MVCGIFAKVNGGQFLFFMPSVHEAESLNTAEYKFHGYAWMYGEPQLLLPLFAVATVAVVYLSKGHPWKRDAAYRFAVGAAATMGGLYALLVLWEFAFTGYFLEYSYYFSLVNVGLLLCGAAVLAALWARFKAAGARGALFVVTVAVAAASPALITYSANLAPVGRSATVISLALMSGLLVVLLLLRRLRGRRFGAAGILVLAAAFTFTFNYAGVGATQTHSAFSGSYRENRAVLSVALQLIDFMRANGLQNGGVPAFWYNPSEDENLNGIQSTYLWGDTWVGLDMPRINRSMRTLLAQRQPQRIVLLCKTHACRGGPAALRAAGYSLRQFSQRLLSSGLERVWVRAFVLGISTANYYMPGQAALIREPSTLRGRIWSLADGAPSDWSGVAADDSRTARGKPFATSERMWDYELVSPDEHLQAGSYALELRGKVLSGGLDLGVLDIGTNNWIQQRTYWYGQKGFGIGWMDTPFRLGQPTTVRFVLSNWVPKAARSRWQLSELRLVRTA